MQKRLSEGYLLWKKWSVQPHFLFTFTRMTRFHVWSFTNVISNDYGSVYRLQKLLNIKITLVRSIRAFYQRAVLPETHFTGTPYSKFEMGPSAFVCAGLCRKPRRLCYLAPSPDITYVEKQISVLVKRPYPHFIWRSENQVESLALVCAETASFALLSFARYVYVFENQIGRAGEMITTKAIDTVKIKNISIKIECNRLCSTLFVLQSALFTTSYCSPSSILLFINGCHLLRVALCR